MFVVQRVVDSVVRPILGRFVKGGEQNIQSDNSTSAVMYLKELEFREDALNLLLEKVAPNLQVTKGEVGSIRVDMTWSGGTILWNNVSVHLVSARKAKEQAPQAPLPPDEELELSQPPPPSPSPPAEMEPLGWSLRSYSSGDLLEFETAEDLLSSLHHLRSSFTSPIRSVQRKFDAISEALVHKFTNIQLDWEGVKLEISSAEYSRRNGLLVHALELTTPDCVGAIQAQNIIIPAFDEDGLKSVSVDVVSVVVAGVLRLIPTTKTNANTDSESEPATTEPPALLKTLEVHIESLRCLLPDEAELSISKAHVGAFPPVFGASQISLSYRDEWIRVSGGALMKVSELAPEPSASFQLDSSGSLDDGMTAAFSPFEDDKLFLFRSQQTPFPVANTDDMEKYRQSQRKTSRRNITITCGRVETAVLTPLLWYEWVVQRVLVELKLQTPPSTPEAGAGFSLEAEITEHVKLNIEHFPELVIQKPTVFRGTGEFWSATAKQITLANTIARHIRVAGEDLKRVSVDVAAGLIDGLDQLVLLLDQLPPMEEDQAAMDVFVRVKQLKLRANKYYCRDVRASNVEVFTGNSGTSVTITAGRAESKSTHRASHYGIRATALQVTIGDGDGIKVSIAGMNGIASDQDLKDIIDTLTPSSSLSSPAPPVVVTEPEFEFSAQTIIRGYRGQAETESVPTPTPSKVLKWKITVRQSRLKLYTVAHQQEGHIELMVDLLKLRSFDDSTLCVSLERGECLDRTAASVWNKAVIVRGMIIEANTELKNYSITVGTSTQSSGRYRTEDVTLTLDQCFIDCVVQFISSLSPETEEEEEEEREKPIWIESITILPFKARVDYKPPRDPNHQLPNYIRYLPLRSAVIKVDLFDAYEVTEPGELAMKFGLHAFGGGQNLSRIIAGFKPIRTPVNVFRNAAELVFVPLNAPRDGMTEVIQQARQAATRTAISVLELGPAINVRAIDQPPGGSIHSNQPSGVKEGFVRAGQVLKKSTTTVVAFVTGDRRNVDLFDLPVMVLRPFTAPLSEILNGMCNQLDRDRYQRLKDKYR